MHVEPDPRTSCSSSPITTGLQLLRLPLEEPYKETIWMVAIDFLSSMKRYAIQSFAKHSVLRLRQRKNVSDHFC